MLRQGPWKEAPSEKLMHLGRFLFAVTVKRLLLQSRSRMPPHIQAGPKTGRLQNTLMHRLSCLPISTNQDEAFPTNQNNVALPLLPSLAYCTQCGNLSGNFLYMSRASTLFGEASLTALCWRCGKHT